MGAIRPVLRGNRGSDRGIYPAIQSGPDRAGSGADGSPGGSGRGDRPSSVRHAGRAAIRVGWRGILRAIMIGAVAAGALAVAGYLSGCTPARQIAVDAARCAGTVAGCTAVDCQKECTGCIRCVAECYRKRKP